jgi:outer membrane lipopolysaccharide assembly protein LptE/RlpB
MRFSTMRVFVIAAAAALMLAGCGHKLRATGNDATIALYPDEDTYKKIAQMKSEGGVAGMLGGLGQNLATKQIDNHTPVRIISSDDLGAQVEITDGVNKGAKGFVAKANVD